MMFYTHLEFATILLTDLLLMRCAMLFWRAIDANHQTLGGKWQKIDFVDSCIFCCHINMNKGGAFKFYKISVVAMVTAFIVFHGNSPYQALDTIADYEKWVFSSKLLSYICLIKRFVAFCLMFVQQAHLALLHYFSIAC